MGDLSVAVVVPTYRRPQALERCLRALADQSSPADRIVVVARDDDHETAQVAERAVQELASMEIATVATPGQIAAIEAGIARCEEDVVAHTDDDAAPRPDWLARLRGHYGPNVGGVGGRDVICDRGAQDTIPAHSIGRLTWYGRMTGGHHLGTGPPVRTHVLKGVNMSMRRGLWRLDNALRGDGAQVHMEMAVCGQACRDRWQLIYDPKAIVDHFPAARLDEDDREAPTLRARENAAWNYSYVTARYFPARRVPIVLAYALLVGYRSAPGMVAWVEACFRHPRDVAPATRVFAAITWARLGGSVAGIRLRLWASGRHRAERSRQ